ncbi:MAG: hypothetical protein MPJ78_15565 [Hyphomicrobiaceae bacterium]|nr:hypothetical protein [Hyphomicrobiaceae bacterium]
MTLKQDTNPSPELPRIETTQAAQALCKRIHETTTDLIDLLDRETAMLKKGKPGEIESVHVRKAALNALITRDMSVFRRDAEFIKMAAPGEINAIKEQHAQFKKSLDANHDALVAMKAVSESLLHTIATRAKTHTAGPETYGQDADVSVGDATGRSAISVNTVL